ncbi:MAG: competence/damage-inducible protein A [Clostridia bacterium]|nr:competence/damage-inducible protein A [Clostridia bacterium]
MNCEILAVGTELLMGEIVNTDAQMIAQGLNEHGFNVYWQTVVGDNPQRLREALETAKRRADILITTGGLGPTADDLTKETVAEVFGRPLKMDQQQLTRLRERMGPKMTPNNEKQAMLPENCTVLVNDWGTAPGCAFESDGCHVIMLPGPPRECTPMFKERAVPYLENLCGGVIGSRYVKIFGVGESSVEYLTRPLADSLENVTMAPYAKEGECELRVTARAETREQALALCDPVVEQVRAILGNAVYGVDVSSLEEVVVKGLAEKGMTVACAESCTGGLIAKRITDISGASEVFGYGCVTYWNEAKMQVLGVSPETIERYTEVSGQCALEMARGVRKLSGASVGVSTTGYAGPTGGTEENPVGTVFIGLSWEGGETVFRPDRRYMRTREQVRRHAANHAFDLIRREVLKK